MEYSITDTMDTSTFVGTGFAYLQSKLLKPISAKSNNKSFDEQSNNETASSSNSCISLVPDGPNLSENAKRILMQLLQQENVQLKNYRTNSIVSSSMISNFVKSTDISQQDLSKKIVNSEMSDETILDLAYNQEVSLLGSILSVIDQYPNTNLSTATTGTTGGITSTSVSSNYIVQRCALAVIPQKTPGLLSAKEMIYAALHFLCQEYPPLSKKYTDSTLITIQLPLIQSTSMSNDIERRSYEKLYDWDINSIVSQILILEQYFYNAIHIDCYTISQSSLLSSSSSTTTTTTTTTIVSSEKKLNNPLMWLPREMFIPNKIPNELQREILVKGSIPVDTKNSTTTTSTKTGTSTNNKSKSTSAVATTNTNTNSTTSSNNSTKKIQIKRKSQSISTPTSSTKEESESTIATTSPKPKSILKKIKITPKRKLSETDNNDTVNVTTKPEITMIQSEQLENTYGSSEAQMPQEATTTSSPNINIDVMATNVYDEDETDDDDNDDADVNDEQLLFD